MPHLATCPHHHKSQGDTTHVAVKIRLKRMGKIRVPQYRIVVVDSRKKRDGKVIEEIGKYHPKEEPSFISIVGERAQYWLGVGAQPTEAVEKLLKITGDWQQFKGLPGTEGTLRAAPAKPSKLDIFNEALKEAAGAPKAEAVTRKAAKKAQPAKEPAAEPVVAPTETAAETPVEAAEASPVAGTPAAETPAAETPAESSAETVVEATEAATETAAEADEPATSEA